MKNSAARHSSEGRAAGPSVAALRLLTIAHDDPRELRTFSGIPANLLERMSDRGADVTSLSAAPSRLWYAAAGVSTFSPNLRSWRARYRVGQPFAVGMRRRAEHAISELRESFDVLLQFGSWFDLQGIGSDRIRLRATYIDTNFASYLDRPDVDVGADSRLARWRLGFEREVYDGLDVIFTFSEWTRRSMIENFDQDPAKVVCVGAGSNVPSVDEARPPIRTGPRFLFVGKKFERKGGPGLLEAFARVREEFPTAELWIVGPERREWPAGPGVVFWGRLSSSVPGQAETLQTLYRNATAFVMPSVFEPFGVVFVEAMQYGLACIGADTCAMPEIIDDGVSGLLVSVGNVEELSTAMVQLAQDPVLASSMGQCGQRRARTQFTWEAVAEKMEQDVRSRL